LKIGLRGISLRFILVVRHACIAADLIIHRKKKEKEKMEKKMSATFCRPAVSLVFPGFPFSDTV